MKKPSKEIQELVIAEIYKTLHFEGASMLFPYREKYKDYQYAEIAFGDIVKNIKWERRGRRSKE